MRTPTSPAASVTSRPPTRPSASTACGVLDADGVSEELTIESTGGVPLEVVLRIDLGTDLAPMSEIKQGRAGPRVQASSVPDGLRAWETSAGRGARGGGGGRGRPRDGRLTWRLTVARRVRADRVAPRQHVGGPGSSAAAARRGGRRRSTPATYGWTRVVRQGLADLEGLLLRDGGDRFLAAGQPVVPHPVRTRLALGRPPADAARPRSRAVDAADPGPAPGEGRGPGDRGAARQDPARGPSGDARPRGRSDCRRSTTAASTRPRSSSARSPTPPSGAPTREQVRELLPAARRCLEWMMAQSVPHRAG